MSKLFQQKFIWGLVVAGIAIWGIYFISVNAGLFKREQSVVDHKVVYPVSVTNQKTVVLKKAETQTKVPEHQHLAASLEGTDIDGSLKMDADGNLIINSSVRDFFDYILSAVGEVTIEQALDFIRRYSEANLSPQAVKQTMALLKNYLSFKEHAAQLMQQPLLPIDKQTPAYYLDTLTQTFDQLYELRRTHMNPEIAEAFFGVEEAYIRYSLQKAHIQLDATLTQEEKQQNMDLMAADLPSVINESILNQEKHNTRFENTQRVLNSNISLEDKRNNLYLYHDVETANTIIDQVEKDKKRADKFDQYTQAKKKLCSEGWSKSEYAMQLSQLKSSFFPSEQERKIAETQEAILARKDKSGGNQVIKCGVEDS